MEFNINAHSGALVLWCPRHRVHFVSGAIGSLDKERAAEHVTCETESGCRSGIGPDDAETCGGKGQPCAMVGVLEPESEDAKSHRLGEMHDLACRLIALGPLADSLWALRQAYEDAETVGTTGASHAAEIAVLLQAMAPAEAIGATASCGMCAAVAPLVPDPFGGKPVCAACRAMGPS